MSKALWVGMLVAVWALAAGDVWGQQDEKDDKDAAETAKTDEEATEEQTPLTAKVVEVTGDVQRAPTGTSPLDEGWTPVKADEELPGGTLIRTGIRSSCILLFGEDTVINIKRMTLASITDVYQTATQKTVRLGLGYGAIRGGSTEGTLRSSLVIDSTVATLAKRGTEGFEMEVEPYTGRFTISLAREGLVEALQKRTGQRKAVRPGQYANDINIATMWIKQDQFDRTVKFVSAESVTTADLDFSVANPRGMATVVPGGGTEVASLTPRASREFVTDQVVRETAASTQQALRELETVVVEQPIVRRPEGNFGVSNTIRILVPEKSQNKAIPRLLPRRFSQSDVDRWAKSGTRRR